MEIRRGQIWYVKTPCWTGEEMPENRPGVVVSCNDLNERSGCVLMALLSESEQHIGEPYVATVKSTGVVSTAVCSKLVTVDKTRLGTYMGTVKAQEMRSIEKGIMASLKLKGSKEEDVCCDPSVGLEADSSTCVGEPLDCGFSDQVEHLQDVVKIQSDQTVGMNLDILSRDNEIAQLKEKIVWQEALKDAYQWQVQGLLDRMVMNR